MGVRRDLDGQGPVGAGVGSERLPAHACVRRLRASVGRDGDDRGRTLHGQSHVRCGGPGVDGDLPEERASGAPRVHDDGLPVEGAQECLVRDGVLDGAGGERGRPGGGVAARQRGGHDASIRSADRASAEHPVGAGARPRWCRTWGMRSTVTGT